MFDLELAAFTIDRPPLAQALAQVRYPLVGQFTTLEGVAPLQAELIDDFPYMEHVAQTTGDGIQADVRAAVEYLRSPAGGSCSSVFTVGFCFGGRNSWLAAASGHGLAGAVGFYGRPGERDGAPGPIQRAGEIEAPILALQAGADQNITAEDNFGFEAALEAAGVEHDLHTYEGAPHSFFDRKQEEFAAASEDAWARVLAFIAAHS